MEEKVLSLQKYHAKFLNELNRRKFENEIKELENDPDVIYIEKWRERLIKDYETSNNPIFTMMILLHENFHEQLEIHKQILRDCMNFDLEKETTGLEMKSMQRCLEESRKRLYSLVDSLFDQLKEMPFLLFFL
jgi:hypothetical protein